MDRNSIAWRGPMVAVITNFDQSGNIDQEAFSINVERMFDNRATGIVVGGCTGEFWALSHEERCQLFHLGVQSAKERGDVIVGTGAITAKETIQLTLEAEQAGCSGALILPPYFVKLTDDEIFCHYEKISAETNLPIILYNIPANAVNSISPALALRLSELDQVVAIKESCGDWNHFYATLIEVKNELRVFCGPSSIYGAPATSLGADGTIDCFPNLWAPGGMDLFYSTEAGRLEESQSLQITGQKLTKLFTSGGRTLYPSTKAAMDLLGYPGGNPREPLRQLNQQAIHELKTGLIALEILKPQ
jgi:dihydrodipicolinate synthase/N-acetylneuraminate lyase